MVGLGKKSVDGVFRAAIDGDDTKRREWFQSVDERGERNFRVSGPINIHQYVDVLHLHLHLETLCLKGEVFEKDVVFIWTRPPVANMHD